MTQLEFILWINKFGRIYNSNHNRENAVRRNAKKKASRDKCLKKWRSYLPGYV
jgi:hypothetical protein